MKKHIAQFFKFLQDKEGKSAPLELKILNPEDFGKPTKEDLKLDRSLFLQKTDIKELPQGLEVGYDLDLERCTSLETLPQGLKVGTDLNLKGCTSLKELPQGLQVGWNLNLERCLSLEKLPQNLQVRRDLDLEGCISLKELPQGLKVGGTLWLYETSIAEKYSEEEIRKMIEDGGGFVKENIYI